MKRKDKRKTKRNRDTEVGKDGEGDKERMKNGDKEGVRMKKRKRAKTGKIKGGGKGRGQPHPMNSLHHHHQTDRQTTDIIKLCDEDAVFSQAPLPSRPPPTPPISTAPWCRPVKWKGGLWAGRSYRPRRDKHLEPK